MWTGWESNSPQKHCKCFSPKPWYMPAQNKWNVFSDFYLWFVPHNLLTCTSEQGSEQSTLGHVHPPSKSCDLVRAKVPFNGAIPSSVVSFWAGTRNRTEISTLEVSSNNRYTIPASCDYSLGSFHHIYVKGVIKPTNITGVSLSRQTISTTTPVFLALNWINDLIPCTPLLSAWYTRLSNWTLLHALPYWRLDSNQRFKLSSTGIDDISIHRYVSKNCQSFLTVTPNPQVLPVS